MKKKSLLCIMLAIIMCLSSTLTAYAAVSWPSISSHKPIKVYTISTGNNTPAYSDSTFQHKIGTIYASDELYVQSIYQNSNGVWGCILTYPTSKGRKTAHVPLSVITNATELNSRYTAIANLTTYRRISSSLKAGSISKGDIVYKLAEQGSYVQVLYNIGSANNPSAWRMAWVTASDFNKAVQAVGVNPQGCLDRVISDRPGEITVGGWTLDKDNLSANLAVHIYVGGPAGSGAPGYAITANTSRPDVNNAYPGVGNNHGFDATISVSVTGTQTVYVYACNVGGGTNVLIGTKTVNIQSNASNTSANTANGYMIQGVNIGYRAGSYFTDNGKACTDHGTKGIHSYYNEKACNCICTYNGKSLGAVQCYGFARYVQTKLYGVNSYDAPSKFYKLSGSSVAAGALTASKIKSLVQTAGVGAHIRTGGSQHSMIITNITSDGFTIIQCNGSNNQEYSGYYACRIGTYTYTWNSYVSSTYGQRGLSFIEKIK
mgnify:CR=1 FL=1